MGLYRDLKKTIVYIGDQNHIVNYESGAERIASNTKMNVERAHNAFELAKEEGLIEKIPNDQNTKLTFQGKLLLKKRFGTTDLFIASYKSASHILAIIAIIISVVSLIVSIYLKVK